MLIHYILATTTQQWQLDHRTGPTKRWPKCNTKHMGPDVSLPLCPTNPTFKPYLPLPCREVVTTHSRQSSSLSPCPSIYKPTSSWRTLSMAFPLLPPWMKLSMLLSLLSQLTFVSARTFFKSLTMRFLQKKNSIW